MNFLFRLKKCSLSLVLSPLIILALLINAGATPARASTLQRIVGPDPRDCPDSLLITGTQDLRKLWDQLERKFEDDEGSKTELGSQSDENLLVDISQPKNEITVDYASPGEDFLVEAPSKKNPTMSGASQSIVTPPRWQRWQTGIGLVWSQILILLEERPDLTIEEFKKIFIRWVLLLSGRMPGTIYISSPKDMPLDQIVRVWEEMPELSFEEAMEVWGQIHGLRVGMPDLNFGEAKEIWAQIRDLREEMPELSFEEAKEVWHIVRLLRVAVPELREVAAPYKEKAKTLLLAHGFEDSDGDGLLNWPPDSPFSGQNLDFELIVAETTGIVIGFVPIAGDAVDGVALTLGKDPFTGRCLTRAEQILLVIAIISLLPISVKSVRVIGKQLDRVQPFIKRFVVNSLPDLPISVRLSFLSNLVHPKYEKLRLIAGEGTISADKLARELGFPVFASHNYRKALQEFTGVSRKAVEGLEAHHILPQEFEERFLASGIDNIHDPRLLVWVDKTEHKSWSQDFSVAWNRFFEHNPNPTKSQVLKEAQEMADEVGYQALFRASH